MNSWTLASSAACPFVYGPRRGGLAGLSRESSLLLAFRFAATTLAEKACFAIHGSIEAQIRLISSCDHRIASTESFLVVFCSNCYCMPPFAKRCIVKCITRLISFVKASRSFEQDNAASSALPPAQNELSTCPSHWQQQSFPNVHSREPAACRQKPLATIAPLLYMLIAPCSPCPM